MRGKQHDRHFALLTYLPYLFNHLKVYVYLFEQAFEGFMQAPGHRSSERQLYVRNQVVYEGLSFLVY